MREPGWRWSTPHNYYYQQRAVPRIRQKETPPVLPPPHPGASILHEKPLRPLCRKEFPRTAHPKPAAPWLLPGVQRVERQALGMWPEAEGDGSGACPQGVTLVLGGAVQMIRWRHRGALWAFGGGAEWRDGAPFCASVEPPHRPRPTSARSWHPPHTSEHRALPTSQVPRWKEQVERWLRLVN